jgi:hypothetical protein
MGPLEGSVLSHRTSMVLVLVHYGRLSRLTHMSMISTLVWAFDQNVLVLLRPLLAFRAAASSLRGRQIRKVLGCNCAAR